MSRSRKGVLATMYYLAKLKPRTRKIKVDHCGVHLWEYVYVCHDLKDWRETYTVFWTKPDGFLKEEE